MWKFLIAVAAVVGLLIFGNSSITIPHIPTAVLTLPAIIVVFAAGMFITQR